MNIQSALVRAILERSHAFTWTVQGFGFLRTKIADVGRIHIWDSRLTVPLVSTMHTHPWALRSEIISGELINQRFGISSDGEGIPYTHSRLKTGEGGNLIGESEPVVLWASVPETYRAGHTYGQKAEEIHRSIAQDGTVTLMERPQGPPLEEASVYWPRGTEWRSAEPRPAEDYEVQRTVGYALSRWAAA